jgi:hypothetical protein
MSALFLRIATAVALLVLPAAAWPADLEPHLAPLKPLLGRTWRGVFPDSTPEKPLIDISRFEAALNGQAVRNLHSINDGFYGGETLIVWDKEKQSLVYYYFSTGGFYTTGTMRAADGSFESHEIVKGGEADGVSEVKGSYRLLPDGRLHAKTQYLKQGKWVEARDMHYVEAPGAVVKFKD